MTATSHSDEVASDAPELSIEWRESPQSEAGGFPDPEARNRPFFEPEPYLPPEPIPEPEPEEPEEDAPAGDIAPPEVEQVLAADPDPDFRVREIPGGAGHGPARAYGYIAIATALGASAELTSGGTRSTSRNPLIVTVRADDDTFSRVNEIYDAVAPEAEGYAALKRTEARRSGSVQGSYEVSLLTRAVLAGFPQGAASALREPGATRPAPFREATRARLSDEHAHRSAVVAGRAWAMRNLPAARREESHSAA